jgi:hypothetical protein
VYPSAADASAGSIPAARKMMVAGATRGTRPRIEARDENVVTTR